MTTGQQLTDAFREVEELFPLAKQRGHDPARRGLLLASRCLMFFVGDDGLDPYSDNGRSYLARASIRGELQQTLGYLRDATNNTPDTDQDSYDARLRSIRTIIEMLLDIGSDA